MVSNKCYNSFNYTGRLIMYSGITIIYYWNIVGHVFTKFVQLEGTVENFLFL
jgi:hypothetical protein